MGHAFVSKALQAGARVFLSWHENESCAEDFQKQGAEIFRLDLASIPAMDECTAWLKSKIEHLDVLVHNAAAIRDHTLQNMSEEDWDVVMTVNLRAPYYLTKKLLPLLFRRKKKKSGLSFPQFLGGNQDSGSPAKASGDDICDGAASKIFFITSRAAITGGFGISNYAASKAGLIGLSKSLAQELGKRQILVNAVNPGFMMSKMTESLPQEVIEKNRELSPLGRFSNPDEVADFLVYLSSDAMTQVTGQVLHFESRKI